MSFLKGFSASKAMLPPCALEPVFQRFYQEHHKVMKLLAQTMELGKYAAKHPEQQYGMDWLQMERRMSRTWRAVSYKEDRALYPMLSHYMDIHVGPVAALLFQRSQIGKQLTDFEGRLDQALHGEPAEFAEAVTGLLEQYRRIHEMIGTDYVSRIEKLYGMAQGVLSESEKASILERLKKIKYKVEYKC